VDAVPAGEAPAEPADVDYKARWEAEVQDRQRERERYKPVAQAFQNLHPDDARAIQDFVRAYASGDTETATRWMIDNARTLAGDKFDTYVSPAQEAAIAQQAHVDGAAQGLTPQQVEQMVEQRIQQFQMAQVQKGYEAQIEQTLVQHGYQPDSPLATAAIVAASKRPDLDLTAAIREVEEQVLAQAQAIATQRAAAASTMGNMPPVSNGVAAINNPVSGMSPRERAMARLEANGL
jgi:chorismate mutase